MNIALIGYGKMGRIIERLATKRGHEIGLIIDENNRSQITPDEFSEIDVAIDFSTPDAVLGNIQLCFSSHVPVVVGTTGWYDEIDSVKRQCQEEHQAILYGSNFSVGVNVFFHINKLLAKAMAGYKQYDVQVEEIHHVQKLDAPSGTAITIADGILDYYKEKIEWVNSLDGDETVIPKQNQLLIESHRMDEVPGTHTVLYSSEVDQLEFKHTAHSREGFAFGAVLAAEWIRDKKGFFSVDQMFDFSL